MKAELKKIEWQAPEYEFMEKGPDWFWAVGILGAALFIVAVLLHNFLFGVMILLAGFSILLYGAKRPALVFFSVGPTGIKINDRVYDYEDLKCFWVNYNPPLKKELLVESKKTFMPRFSIPLGATDPVALREYLLQYLKEEKLEESLPTLIARVLKF